MTFRVYFNRRSDEPWSVDEGTPATERTCRDIVQCGCFWRTRTVDNLLTATTQPIAWLDVEAQSAELIEGKIVFMPLAP